MIKNLIQFSENDYLPMDSFSLKWRFTESQYNVLPKRILSRIIPFNNDVSAEVSRYSMTFLRDFHLDEKKVHSIEFLDNPHESVATGEWLMNKISKETKKIIVSWDERKCVVTEREIFCKYWDDFCYPSSDDVLIFPVIGDWVMYYSHEDQFQFGYGYKK